MATDAYDLNTLKINRSYNSKKPFYKSKKFYYALLSAVILIFILILINPFSSTVEVKVAMATTLNGAQGESVLAASGYVVAQRKAAVASKGMGRLIELNVVEGDEVKKNQILARIEDSDIKAQLEQAKANLLLNEADLKDAENNYERQKTLLKLGSTTKTELEAAEARLLRVKAGIEVAKAGIQGSEVALENTLIRAPFNGKVLTKDADVGEVVSPISGSIGSKGAVVTIADMNSLQVEADVSESNLQKIKINQDCEITLDAYPDVKYPGFVAKIVPTADRSKATVQVKIGFRKYDEKVLPEMSAKILFLAGNTGEQKEASILAVPATAVVNRDGKAFVFKSENGTAVETVIKTGKTEGAFIQVLQGLANYDKIIDNVDSSIKNGVKVKEL